MSYVVSRPNGSWELRRSHSTPHGPRSRTLATFRELDGEAIERALRRADGEISAEEVRAAAQRAGAPLAPDPAIDAAATLTAQLGRGRRLPANWRGVLADLLDHEAPSPTDAERAAAQWAGATPQQHGAALWDLLLLADRIGSAPRTGRLSFPVLSTR